MIEQKLLSAASKLPTPETDFASIVHTADLLTAPKPIRRKQAIALILALLLLGGCAAGAVRYSITTGYATNHYTEAVQLSSRLSVQIPEYLGQSPFHSATVDHIHNRDIPWLLGPLFSQYQKLFLQYGNLSDDISSVRYIMFSFGSTENALWRSAFAVNDALIWSDDNITPNTYDSQPYRDMLLQSGIIDEINHVIWNDEDLNVCFLLASSDYTTHELLTFAKEIIDLNHPD